MPEEIAALKESLLIDGRLSKAAILKWYKGALRALDLRRHGRHPSVKKYLSEDDAHAYKSSIERQFADYKRRFNRQLKEKEKNGSD